MTVQAVYTLDELVRLWKIKKRTLYGWLSLERRAGRAPTRVECCVKIVAGRKALILRADYASKIQDRYVFRAFRRKKVRTIPPLKLAGIE